MTQSLQKIGPDMKVYSDYLKSDIFLTLNCHTIGTIESFDAVKQTASISISFKKVFGDQESDYPVLLDCPVFVLFGGSGRLTFPVKQGDTCLVLFNDRDIDSWFTSGNALRPNSTRKHDLSDGIALVGINSLKTSLKSYSTTKTELIHGDPSTGAMVSLSDAKASVKYGMAGVDVDALVKVYNAVTDLKTVMWGLLDVLKTLQVQCPIPLESNSVAALEAYKAIFATLLK